MTNHTAVTTDELRRKFIEFFEQREHQRIEGASLVPVDDPTLLYINSGMAPLKAYFLGDAEPPHPDLVNVQPCIRTKDIDDVGDRHHLTLFEMLGSWSIGHYFKRRAVELAYELLTDVYGLDPNRLYATVFAGEPSLGLPADEDSAGYWEAVGMPRDHIVALGMDNFWGPAGDTGPCGPCTEIFYDTGAEHGPEYVPGGHFDDKGRYIEIWNAGVFMELDKQPDGTFTKLPFTSVDTGAGLERLAMTMNGMDTVYETDVLAPLVAKVGELSAGGRELPISARRLLADHLRASAFILAEQVRPANVGRGYIVRRLIRKCVAVTTRAGHRAFDFAAMLDLIIDDAGRHYPQLATGRAAIKEAFERERREFATVIDRGLQQLDELAGGADGGRPAIDGGTAFTLFSTYGLPLEIVQEWAAEREGTVDEAGFRAAFAAHQDASRGGTAAAAAPSGALATLAGGSPTTFVGYGNLEADATIVALLVDGQPVQEAAAGDETAVVTDVSSFYSEGGGQIGDRGTITAVGGDAVMQVADTVGAGEVIVHRGVVSVGPLRVGQRVHLAVDPAHRLPTQANHSATHLLGAALRERLGDHVHQAGSLVEPDRLRFDFSHTGGLTAEELADVERSVNAAVISNRVAETQEMSYEEAIATGAMTLPGESYPDRVRVVTLTDASKELCRGTHVAALGEIGAFRIVAEGSVGSGTRRITAVTRAAATELALEREAILDGLAKRLKVKPAQLADRVEALLKQAASAGKGGGAAAAAAVPSTDEVRAAAVDVDGVKVWAGEVGADPSALRDVALQIAEAVGGVAVVLAGAEGTVRWVVAVTPAAPDGLSAKAIIGALTGAFGGKGGGNDRLAQGGGSQRPAAEIAAGVPELVRGLR